MARGSKAGQNVIASSVIQQKLEEPQQTAVSSMLGIIRAAS